MSIPKNKQAVFVFGSNEAGIHGAGAALYARKEYGAQIGFSYGHCGQSFAIPTKDEFLDSLPLALINAYVQGFLAYALSKRKLTFYVTAVGCGLAGFKHSDIAPMFVDHPLNVEFDEAWRPFLGDQAKYWGTFS